MPAPSKPRPKPPVPPNRVDVAGKQEQFQEAGFELAAKLGWNSEPTDATNDINVEDAQNFLVKSLHEFFQAGAKGEELPNHLPVCAHLGIEDANEQKIIETALAKEFEAGKGTKVETVEKTVATVGANLSYDGPKGKGG